MDDEQQEVEATDPPPPDRRSGPPVWRRPAFWVVLIAVEVVVALVVAATFTTDPDRIDLEGADLAAFCASAEALADLPSSGSVDTAGALTAQIEGRRALLEQVAASAPPALDDELEDLIAAQTEVLDLLADLGGGPDASLPSTLSDDLRRIEVDNARATRRFERAVRDGCGFEFSPRRATTTAPPAVSGPTLPR